MRNVPNTSGSLYTSHECGNKNKVNANVNESANLEDNDSGHIKKNKDLKLTMKVRIMYIEVGISK